MGEREFAFDEASRRFRDRATGRFVSEREVRDGVDRLVDLASRRLGDATARFRSGELTAAAWQGELLETIKATQVGAALAAYGGRDAMTPERWGLVGSLVRQQYAYARRFADDVAAGRQRQNGTLDARARLYGQAGRATYELIRRRESAGAGLGYERNVLHAADHCAQCVAEAGRGWVPIGTLMPVGQRTCRTQCRCTLAYARTPRQGTEAA